MLVTSLCRWFYYGDLFNLLNRALTSYQLVGNQHLNNLSPTHFVSKTRHQHRCHLKFYIWLLSRDSSFNGIAWQWFWWVTVRWLTGFADIFILTPCWYWFWSHTLSKSTWSKILLWQKIQMCYIVNSLIYLAFYVTYANFGIFLTENYWISHQEIWVGSVEIITSSRTGVNKLRNGRR